MSNTRKIYKGSLTSQYAVREVLTMVFAQELLAPSKEVFIVAPWISNVVIFNNHIGEFSTLNPEWGRREIRLVDVLVAIVANGTKLSIHTRPDDHNRVFKRRIQEAFGDAGLLDQTCWNDSNALLHTKGIWTDRVLIEGSMNLTESGVALNEEAVTISFDPEHIAAARVHFDLYEKH